MSETRRDNGPLLTATRLYQKTSAAGGTYYVGRMGGLRVLVLKSREVADDGTVIWSLCLQEAQKPAGNAGEGERR